MKDAVAGFVASSGLEMPFAAVCVVVAAVAAAVAVAAVAAVAVAAVVVAAVVVASVAAVADFAASVVDMTAADCGKKCWQF